MSNVNELCNKKQYFEQLSKFNELGTKSVLDDVAKNKRKFTFKKTSLLSLNTENSSKSSQGLLPSSKHCITARQSRSPPLKSSQSLISPSACLSSNFSKPNSTNELPRTCLNLSPSLIATSDSSSFKFDDSDVETLQSKPFGCHNLAAKTPKSSTQAPSLKLSQSRISSFLSQSAESSKSSAFNDNKKSCKSLSVKNKPVATVTPQRLNPAVCGSTKKMFTETDIFDDLDFDNDDDFENFPSFHSQAKAKKFKETDNSKGADVKKEEENLLLDAEDDKDVIISSSDLSDENEIVTFNSKKKIKVIDSDEESEVQTPSEQKTDDEEGVETNGDVDDMNFAKQNDLDFSFVDEDDFEYMDVPTPSPPQFEHFNDDSNQTDVEFIDEFSNSTSLPSLLNNRCDRSNVESLIENIENNWIFKSFTTISNDKEVSKSLHSWQKSIDNQLLNMFEKIPESSLKNIPKFPFDDYVKLREIRSKVLKMTNQFSFDDESTLNSLPSLDIPTIKKSPENHYKMQQSLKPSTSQRLSEKLMSSKMPSSNLMQKSNVQLRTKDVMKKDPVSETQIIEGFDTQEFENMWDEDFPIEVTEEIQEKDYTNLIYNSKSKTTKKISDEDLIRGNFMGDHHDDGTSQKYKSNNFPHSEEMLNMFHQVFGLKKFRNNQLEAINAALLGEDCFILMPTGGGKSICYMLPALVTSGVTIVISPLRSLIHDQVSHLNSLDVPSNYLSGDQSSEMAHQVYIQLQSKIPTIKLLYVTPEKISASAKLMSVLENLYSRQMLARFVIDEAHCVSNWGHDFRPDYKRLCCLKKKFPKTPLMALTATATPRVRIDILHQLCMPKPKWFLQSFNRPNLKYSVVSKKGKTVIADVVNIIQKQFRNKSGIVYCLSRKECDEVAKSLQAYRISAISYHAGLSDKKRVETQDNWINDKYKVVCATIAFGMGIDKADVRYVIHYSLPKSIEGYYQESGRAGRDGEISSCFLFYSYRDVTRMKNIIEKGSDNQEAKKTHIDNLYRMVRYCDNLTDCRRVLQLEYFGEVFERSNCLSNPKTICDNCLRKDTYNERDVTEECKSVVRTIVDMVGMEPRRKSSYTLTYFIDLFKGSNSSRILTANHNRLPVHGIGKSYSRTDAERMLRKLVFDGYIAEDLVITKHDQAVGYVKPGRRASDLLAGKCKITFKVQKGSKKIDGSVVAIAEQNENSELKELQEECYKQLVSLCKTIARERHMQYTYLMNMDALKQMSVDMPVSKEEMLKIPHVTLANYEKFVHRFQEVTAEFFTKRSELEQTQAQWFNSNVQEPAEELSSDWYDASSHTSNKKSGRKRPNYWAFKNKKAKRGRVSQGRGGNCNNSSRPKQNKRHSAPTASTSQSGQKLGFLQDVKPKQRSFLPNPRVSFI